MNEDLVKEIREILKSDLDMNERTYKYGKHVLPSRIKALELCVGTLDGMTSGKFDCEFEAKEALSEVARLLGVNG